MKGVDLKFAVNTNWDVFQHTPTRHVLLRNDQTWMKATELMGGWQPAGDLPDSFKKLPADENWKDVIAAVPGKKVSASNVPTVFVSTTRAELILLKGEPAYEPVDGTSLMWVSNTESDVFRVGKTGLIYFLVAGRWFSASDFVGPWTFASLTLPEDFKKIPLEHDRSRVLASVPGSAQAAEAVMLASIPQTARVNKKTMQPPAVAYDGGTPKFEPIESTKVSRAVNTDKDIIKFGDLYYMCFQGVWFMAKAPEGPWEVTSKVPKEIYEIPVSSPSYNVTYVTVEDDDDEWVTFAAAAAYTGVMIAWGCAVWGTGYVLPALLLRAGSIVRIARRTVTARTTTRGPAHTDVGTRRTDRMAVRVMARGTTRRPERIHAARWPTAPAARAATRKPITRARAATRRRGRDRTCMATGDPRRCSAATSGRTPPATRTTVPATRRASRKAAAAARR